MLYWIGRKKDTKKNKRGQTKEEQRKHTTKVNGTEKNLVTRTQNKTGKKRNVAIKSRIRGRE